MENSEISRPDSPNKQYKFSLITDKKSDKTRGKWSNQFEFVLSCTGYAVGLGNIWRFPYLCMRNGGGAFLIPYFTFLFLCGMPLFYLEVAMGQFSGSSPISLWAVSPIFKGLGWGMVAVSGLMTIYYNLILTWIIYYLVASMTSDLPWSSCDNSWNTDACIDFFDKSNRSNYSSLVNRSQPHFDSSLSYSNRSFTTQSDIYNSSSVFIPTHNSSSVVQKMLTSTEEFWQYNVLELSPGIHQLGKIRWQLLLCLMAAWFLVFLCLFKGIKSVGKVVYFTATAPYIFLVILLIRGALLPGSTNGVLFYITPKWKELLKFKVWAEACLQIFYSLGPAWGGLITMSSYNKFHNNIERDAFVLPLVCCGTSFFAGFVIFSVIGFMASEANLPVREVITSGPGLAFIVYPQALSKLPISPLWSILFFLMLLTVGLDSQFATFETMVSGLVDTFPLYLQSHRPLFTAFMILLEFLIGIPLVTQGGMYLFQLFDWYMASISVMFIGFFECVVFAWIYGVNRIFEDIELMIGRKPFRALKLLWCFVTPSLILIITVYNFFFMSAPTYQGYEYPGWAIAIGWFVASLSVLPIPLCALHEIYINRYRKHKILKVLFTPRPEWGPADTDMRKQYGLKSRSLSACSTTKPNAFSHTDDLEPKLTKELLSQNNVKIVV